MISRCQSFVNLNGLWKSQKHNRPLSITDFGAVVYYHNSCTNIVLPYISANPSHANRVVGQIQFSIKELSGREIFRLVSPSRPSDIYMHRQTGSDNGFSPDRLLVIIWINSMDDRTRGSFDAIKRNRALFIQKKNNLKIPSSIGGYFVTTSKCYCHLMTSDESNIILTVNGPCMNCINTIKTSVFINKVISQTKVPLVSSCVLETPYGDIDLDQYW